MTILATYLAPRPARLTYVVHEAIDFSAVRFPSHAELRAEAEAFRQDHQARLTAQVQEHHAPYNRAPKGRMMRSFFWHEMFLKTAGEPGWLARLYKVPLGYPLIWLARRFTPRQGDA